MSSTGRPLVSIIVPTYNHGEFIVEAVDSVIAQTYPNWEMIIVNNYSTDDTDKLLSRYSDPRIHIKQFRNEGIIARSRNRGLSLAQGQYIAFLDSDDAWHSEKLARQVDVLERHRDVLACSTALVMVPGGMRSPFVHTWDRRLSLGALMRENVVYNSSVLMRRSCMEQIGCFSEDRALRTVEDYEYWLRMLQYRDRSIYFLDAALLRYRVSASNQSGLGRQVDAEAETAKWNRLAEVRFAGMDRERFLRTAQSSIARRIREYGCVDKESPASDPRLLISDRVRMIIARAVKRLVRSLRGGRPHPQQGRTV